MRLYSRPSLRLPQWDYHGYGWYHVTLCIEQGEFLLGDVFHNTMHMNVCGLFVENYFHFLPLLYQFVRLDTLQIMPNHVHVILEFADGSNIPFQQFIPYGDHRLQKVSSKRKSLGCFIAAFKTVTTRQINTTLDFPTGTKIWQRNYFDRIIRAEEELEHVRQYLRENPKKWEQDRENPHSVLR